MKEKIAAFFQNEKVKRFAKRVFSKKALVTVVVILVVVSSIKIAFSLMFEIKGTVKSIDGKSITIANFINTRTIDVGDYPIELKQIQVGDRVEITKNLKELANASKKIKLNYSNDFKQLTPIKIIESSIVISKLKKLEKNYRKSDIHKTEHIKKKNISNYI